MKLVQLRPAAVEDLVAQARHYRKVSGGDLAGRFIDAAAAVLAEIERMPAVGSPRIGQLCEVPELRSWGVPGFPVRWFYLERADCVDVIRLLGDSQDVLTILGAE